MISAIRIVSADDLRPLVTLLRDIPKPIPYSECPALFEQLNWVKTRRRGGRSNFDISFPDVTALEMRGEVSRIEAYVSDFINEDDPAAREALRAAFPELTAHITECIGFPPTGTPLHYEGVDWDLDDGSVIRLRLGEIVHAFMFMSKRIADQERYERRHGINLDDPMEEIDA